jgi:hypothetical protein
MSLPGDPKAFGARPSLVQPDDVRMEDAGRINRLEGFRENEAPAEIV